MTFDADDHVLRALRAGASGFLLKDTPPADIVRALRAVAAVTRRLIGQVAESQTDTRGRRARAQLDRLTEREHEVAVSIALGKTNAEIGHGLYMRVATAKAHVSRILEKPAEQTRPDRLTGPRRRRCLTARRAASSEVTATSTGIPSVLQVARATVACSRARSGQRKGGLACQTT